MENFEEIIANKPQFTDSTTEVAQTIVENVLNEIKEEEQLEKLKQFMRYSRGIISSQVSEEALHEDALQLQNTKLSPQAEYTLGGINNKGYKTEAVVILTDKDSDKEYVIGGTTTKFYKFARLLGLPVPSVYTADFSDQQFKDINKSLCREVLKKPEGNQIVEFIDGQVDAKCILKDLLKEGNEEYLERYIGMGLVSAVLGDYDSGINNLIVKKNQEGSNDLSKIYRIDISISQYEIVLGNAIVELLKEAKEIGSSATDKIKTIIKEKMPKIMKMFLQLDDDILKAIDSEDLSERLETKKRLLTIYAIENGQTEEILGVKDENGELKKLVETLHKNLIANKIQSIFGESDIEFKNALLEKQKELGVGDFKNFIDEQFVLAKKNVKDNDDMEDEDKYQELLERLKKTRKAQMVSNQFFCLNKELHGDYSLGCFDTSMNTVMSEFITNNNIMTIINEKINERIEKQTLQQQAIAEEQSASNIARLLKKRNTPSIERVMDTF